MCHIIQNTWPCGHIQFARYSYCPKAAAANPPARCTVLGPRKSASPPRGTPCPEKTCTGEAPAPGAVGKVAVGTPVAVPVRVHPPLGKGFWERDARERADLERYMSGGDKGKEKTKRETIYVALEEEEDCKCDCDCEEEDGDGDLTARPVGNPNPWGREKEEGRK